MAIKLSYCCEAGAPRLLKRPVKKPMRKTGTKCSDNWKLESCLSSMT